MRHVFILWHTHEDEDLPGSEDVKLLGVYSSYQKAEEALNASLILPGFKECPEGFSIVAYELDEREWTEGFITLREEWPGVSA
jgi:hypothetical protein